jgi:HTH-type transcriptional regulator / antitoxin HigA
MSSSLLANLTNMMHHLKVIESEAEYRQLLVLAESLLVKKNLRTSEETTLFRLVVKLIEDYESEHYNLDDWG